MASRLGFELVDVALFLPEATGPSSPIRTEPHVSSPEKLGWRAEPAEYVPLPKWRRDEIDVITEALAAKTAFEKLGVV